MGLLSSKVTVQSGVEGVGVGVAPGGGVGVFVGPGGGVDVGPAQAGQPIQLEQAVQLTLQLAPQVDPQPTKQRFRQLPLSQVQPSY